MKLSKSKFSLLLVIEDYQFRNFSICSIHFMLKLKGTYEKTNYVIFLRMLKILIKNTSRFMISLFQIIHMLLLAAEVHFEYTRLHCGASAKKAACVLLFYGNVSLLLNSKKFVIIF